MTTLEQPGAAPAEQLLVAVESADEQYLVTEGPAPEIGDTRTPIDSRPVPPQLISSLYSHVEQHGSVEQSEFSQEAAKVAMVRKPHEVVFIMVAGTLHDGNFEADPAYLPRLTILRGDGQGESVDFTQQQDESGATVYIAHHYAGY